jgi:ribonuclease HI
VYELQFDGLFRRVGENTKTGIMAYGWLIVEESKIIARGYGAVAGKTEATSNVAEYLALIEGLNALLDMGAQDETVLVCGDSKIVISQMEGKTSIHAERMKELNLQAVHVARQFRKINYEWRRRSNNKAADNLTRHALKQARKNQPHYDAIIQKLVSPGSTRRSRPQNLVDTFLPLVALAVYRPTGLSLVG